MENISIIYEKLDEDQKIEVQTGIDRGIDVSAYLRPEYLAIQMRQIRIGIEEGLDVSVYSKPEYDWFQMEEIRLGMKSGIAYELYAKPEIDYQRMRQIRKGLEAGIDLSIFVKLEAGILEELRKAIMAKVSIVDFIKDGYVVEQLVEIRTALEKKIDIRPYITTEYRGASIREICLGLEAGLPVSIYASVDYGWQQMREIRLGMEARIDINQYKNSLFSWQQMREIRLGLEEGLDISQYRSFMYTASNMEEIRERLLYDETREIIDKGLRKQNIDESITIFISKDEMEACIEVAGESGVTQDDILNKLKQNGICQGVLTDEIEKLIQDKKFNKTIVIAKGQSPKKGEDGWYEFFFDIHPSRAPKILEDGTADYRDVKWFELAEENQKLAYYHSAGYGKAGFTVTGKFLKAKKGKEKNVLKGQGFRVENDGKTYVSNMNGKVVYDGNNRLDVSRICVLGDVNLATGNVNFDGTVYIKGNIGTGAMVTATENVYVDGYVESAVLKSGGEIFLRNGVNGSGSGLIEAKENITGQFFEDVKVVSGGDISGQYCMNCELYAQGSIVLHGNKGLLIGGYARGAKGITAYSVGNKAGIRTVLSAGIDQEILKLHKKAIEEIENVNRELAILQHSKLDFQNKYIAEVRNTMEIYLKIENAVYTKELQLKYLFEEKECIEEHMIKMKGSKIAVKGVLYEGAELTIDNAVWKAFSVKDVVASCVKDKIIMESQ